MDAQLSPVIGERSLNVNGQPCVIFRGPKGGVFSVMSFRIVGGRVATIRSIVNPDKLGHLGPVESLREVMDAAHGGPTT